jgi:protein-S-isoprenylcysteine O-methyltransferase Ste14
LPIPEPSAGSTLNSWEMRGDGRSKQGGARVRLPPPLAFAAAIAAGIFLPPHLGLPLAARLLLGGILVVAGLGVAISAIKLFRKTGQDPRPWMPSPELIFDGPYRFSRNPMYVSMVMIACGIGLCCDRAAVMFLSLAALAVVHFTAVLPEERYLQEQFGERYSQYKSRVRRYL